MSNLRLQDDSVGDGVLVPSATFTVATLPYSTVIATDGSKGNFFTITVTDGVAFTISSPTNVPAGKVIRYLIRNASGGAMGVITWGALFKMPAFANPANANSRSIEFLSNGTNLIEIDRTAADVPN